MSPSKITPDTLHQIARRIPIFERVNPLSQLSDVWHDPRRTKYKPSNLLPCTLVCRQWHTIFTPYLYQYYVDNHLELPLNKDKQFLAFRKRSHLIRWYLSHTYSEDYQKRLPFDLKNPPKNLAGLILIFDDREQISQLLIQNQGARLKELTWVSPQLGVYREAFLNLPCLEELDLRVTLMSDEALYRILSGCAETLRTLRLQVDAGFSSKLFDFGTTTTTTTSISIGKRNNQSSLMRKPTWMMPRLKALQLFLPLEHQDVFFRLPLLCPALETIYVDSNDPFGSFMELTTVLREHCPLVHTIGYGDFYDDSLFYPDSQDFIPLLTESVQSQCLQRAAFGLPKGLDGYIMGALLQHATTLVELELWSRPEAVHAIVRLERMAILLSQCSKLKALRFPRLNADVTTLEDLLVAPWACQGLQTLIIDGYTAEGMMQAGVWFEGQKPEPPQRRSGDPQRPIHHEYSDVGQGWFMKPKMKQEYYCQALEDSGWKCKLFEHMYTTSGIKNVEYVRLNGAQFFPSSQ